MYLFYLVLYVRVALNAKNVISNVGEMSLCSTKFSTDPLPCGTPPNLEGEFLVSKLFLCTLLSVIFALFNRCLTSARHNTTIFCQCSSRYEVRDLNSISRGLALNSSVLFIGGSLNLIDVFYLLSVPTERSKIRASEWGQACLHAQRAQPNFVKQRTLRIWSLFLRKT